MCFYLTLSVCRSVGLSLRLSYSLFVCVCLSTSVSHFLSLLSLLSLSLSFSLSFSLICHNRSNYQFHAVSFSTDILASPFTLFHWALFLLFLILCNTFVCPFNSPAGMNWDGDTCLVSFDSLWNKKEPATFPAEDGMLCGITTKRTFGS